MTTRTVGYSTQGVGGNWSWDSGVHNSAFMQRDTQTGDYTMASGDTVTGFDIYINGGSGADTTLAIGLYNVTAPATTPASAPRRVTANIIITAAMKAAPGWQHFTPTLNISTFTGQILVPAIAGSSAGIVLIAQDTTGGTASEQGFGSATLPATWAAAGWDGTNTTRLSAYFTITLGAAAAPDQPEPWQLQGGMLVRMCQ